MTATLTAEQVRAFAERAGMFRKTRAQLADTEPAKPPPRQWNETIRDLAIGIAAGRFGCTYTEIRLRGRNEPVVSARQLAMYLCRQSGMHLRTVGKLFHRNHGTVIHACRQAESFSTTKFDLEVFRKNLPPPVTGSSQRPTSCEGGDPRSQDDQIGRRH